MIEKLIIMLAKSLSWDELIVLLKEHIEAYERNDTYGKEFLAKTCMLVAMKVKMEEEKTSIEEDLAVKMQEVKDMVIKTLRNNNNV